MAIQKDIEKGRTGYTTSLHRVIQIHFDLIRRNAIAIVGGFKDEAVAEGLESAGHLIPSLPIEAGALIDWAERQLTLATGTGIFAGAPIVVVPDLPDPANTPATPDTPKTPDVPDVPD